MFQRLTRLDTKLVYTYSLLIGMVTGLAAIAFYYCLSAATHFTYQWLMHLPVHHGDGETIFFAPIAGEARRWVFFFLPAIGGLLAGLLIFKVAPEAAGTGTDSFLDCFHNKAGRMRRRISWVKPIATIFTLSSGGSAGKEGPVVQLGAAFGAIMASLVNAGARARRTFLLAGAAGGLGAIFRAPLGGAITAVEVLYKEDLETDAMIPCLLSSVMAYTVFGTVLGFGHIFHIQSVVSHHLPELLIYIFLGLLCSGVGYCYTRFFHGVGVHLFQRLRIKNYFVPAVGGLLVGCVGFFFPEATGASLGFVQNALDGQLGDDWVKAAQMFGLLAVLRIITTSFTISSGGSGGIFGPSLFIGGMLGGLVGTIANHFMPTMVPSVAPFIVVGMAAFFACVAKAPIASMIMVSELTGGYELLPPLIIVAAVSLIFSHRQSIYKNQVLNKFFSKAHLWDMNPNVLQKVTIKESFQETYPRRAIINSSDSYSEVEVLASRYRETDFLVKDDKEKFAGVISFKDLYFDKEVEEIRSLLVVDDLAVKSAYYVTPEENLYIALERLLESALDKIPVVDNEENMRLLGYLRQKDILRVYKKSFQEEPGRVEISQSVLE